MTSVQVAKATEALAAKTEELAAKAAEMEAVQQCFNAKHAELEELQAGEGEVQVGGRVCLLVRQGHCSKPSKLWPAWLRQLRPTLLMSTCI